MAGQRWAATNQPSRSPRLAWRGATSRSGVSPSAQVQQPLHDINATAAGLLFSICTPKKKIDCRP